MGTRVAVSMALVACIALAFSAIAQTGAPGNASGAAPKGASVVYVLEMTGKAANQGGPLPGVSGLPGATGAPPKPSPGQSELTLHAGTSLPAAFYDWIAAAIDKRPAGLPFTIRAFDLGTARVVQSAVVDDARAQALGFPALDAAAGNVPLVMDVKVLAMLRGNAPVVLATTQQVRQVADKLAAVRWLVSGYRLTLIPGTLDMSGVSRIEPFTLTPGGALNLQLTLHGNTINAVSTIVPPAPVKGRPPVTPPPLDAQLQLFSATGQPLATISLHNIVIQNYSRTTGLDRATGGAQAMAQATLVAKQAKIAFTPGISQ